jgi:CDP-diacylglycerol pyrophosphatase
MPNWRKPPPQDYLKYWRVVRYFVKAKYGLPQADLDILLFLYSEKYFSKDKFMSSTSCSHGTSNASTRLLRDGWISVFRKKEGNRRVGI